MRITQHVGMVINGVDFDGDAHAMPSGSRKLFSFLLYVCSTKAVLAVIGYIRLKVALGYGARRLRIISIFRYHVTGDHPHLRTH